MRKYSFRGHGIEVNAVFPHRLARAAQGTGVRVTLIEPGMVDTPFFDQRPPEALEDEDIARGVIYALSQPPHVDVNEILIRPTGQSL